MNRILGMTKASKVKRTLAACIAILLLVSVQSGIVCADTASDMPQIEGLSPTLAFSNTLTIGVQAFKGASAWALPELNRAAEYGFITDRIKDNLNGPITREEFAEVAVKLYEKYTGKTAVYPDMDAFVDTQNPEIFKAYNLKIVNGTDAVKKLFSPKNLTNREQVAAMLYRAVKAIKPEADFSTAGSGTFSDYKFISGWSLESVKFMSKNGFIKGSAGKFDPKGTCTREMAVIIATRVYEQYSGKSASLIDEAGAGISTAANGETVGIVKPHPGYGSVSAEDKYCMAILDDNTLWGWGMDENMHFGMGPEDDGVVERPAMIIDNAESVFAGPGATLVIRKDKTLWAWGAIMQGAGEDRLTFIPKPQKITDNVISAASGARSVLVVKADGSLLAWGDNTVETRLNPNLKVIDKQGRAIYKPVISPMKLMDGVKMVTTDQKYSFCILKDDGTLLYYGGKFGGDSKVNSNGLEYYKLATGVKDVSMGENSLYFIKNDGSLWGLGKAVYEGLGTYDENQSPAYDSTPVKVMDDVKAVAVSSKIPIALKKDGKLIAWGNQLDMEFQFESQAGFDFSGDSVDLESINSKKTIVLMDNVRTISAGGNKYLIKKNDGTVWIWGPNEYSDLGVDSIGSIGTCEFIELDFSLNGDKLFTSSEEKSKLFSDWLKMKEASGDIPGYDAGFKANWSGEWYQDQLTEVAYFVQTGSIVCGYNIFDALVLYGTVSGNKLKGYVNRGLFELTMLPGGKSFTGLAYYNNDIEPWKCNGEKK